MLYKAPGVYVEQVPSGVRVIAAAATSVAAFIGPTDTPFATPLVPEKVNTWQEYLDQFVDLTASATKPQMTNALYGWFTNGGGPCYILNVDPASTNLDAALDALKAQLDVTMVAVPGLDDITGIDAAGRPLAQKAVVNHCEAMGNRVALLDLPKGTIPTDAANLDLGLTGLTASFAAVYYPWLQVPSAYDASPVLIPPSGHVAGTWARTDADRGVYKAPANVAVNGLLDLEFTLTDDLQGPLNDKGFNCLRTFPSQGSLVWGARTQAVTDVDWRYLNVRRYVNFLSDSIKQSTQWAVFEPNNADLQARVRGTATSFLTDQWRSGALVGKTAADAFYVVCDETNNTPATMAQGQLICDIGVAPTRPAEFVVFRITQTYGA
ncbi:phage tail sheath family protein [Kitasatospora sp. NPDC091257]|uniref:phage tail sheath family protein n=1 Tax=unclassified Kitasatospora TaxID=2633591 RepID=UPI002F9097D3